MSPLNRDTIYILLETSHIARGLRKKKDLTSNLCFHYDRLEDQMDLSASRERTGMKVTSFRCTSMMNIKTQRSPLVLGRKTEKLLLY